MSDQPPTDWISSILFLTWVGALLVLLILFVFYC